MTDSDKPRQMPKGGRKGGTQFPRIGLEKAAVYSKKLVSKTHTGPQPDSVILKGVFDARGGEGQVRAGAMKQYGLMTGNAEAYEASERAKNLVAAPPDEIKTYLQEAFLNAKVFKTLYDTFVGDTISRAKIRQQAAALDVHPESLDKATQLFCDGAVHCGLASPNGDDITILRPNSPTDPTVTPQKEGDVDLAKSEAAPECDGESVEEPLELPEERTENIPKSSARAVASVTFNVDSTMDTDKLEKQLKLLRKFGVI